MRDPAGAGGRVSRLLAGGEPVAGTLLPAAPAGTTVMVEAVIALPDEGPLVPGAAGSAAMPSGERHRQG